MSNQEKKYPIISDKEYNMMVSRNETYNGFVEYADGIVSFVLTEIVVETIPSDNNLNRFTNFRMRTSNKYHQQVIAVNDAIKTNNQNINLKNKEYSQSIQDGRIKTAFRLKADEQYRKIKTEYTFRILKEPYLKNDLDSLIAQYENLVSCIDKNKPFNLDMIPRDLRNTEQAQTYIKHFKITAYKPTSYITRGLTDEEQRRRNYQKALDNWKSADPFASKAVEGMAQGMVLAPLAVGAVEAGGVYALGSGLRAAFKLNTEMWALKAGMSWSAQALVNSPSEVNYIAVAGDAFLSVPVASAVVSGVFEVRPFAPDSIGKLKITGYNKSVSNTAIDIGSASVFGKTGSYSWGKLSPMLNNNAERYIMFISTQTWNTFGNYGAAKKYNNGSGAEEK